MCERSLDRRSFLTASAVTLSAAAALAPTAAMAQAEGPAPVPMKDGKPDISPDDALTLLRQGNQAFVEGRTKAPDLSDVRRLELASGQAPFCAILNCSDSRVPPELVFGRGLGELFIIRNAGNILGEKALGSIEFAVGVLGVPLVVVMGHAACGAVAAALSVVTENARFPGVIGNMITPILPAVLEARDTPGDALENATKANVSWGVERLREHSDSLLSDPLAAGTLKIVGAYYGLEAGKVDFFDVA